MAVFISFDQSQHSNVERLSPVGFEKIGVYPFVSKKVLRNWYTVSSGSEPPTLTNSPHSTFSFAENEIVTLAAL